MPSRSSFILATIHCRRRRPLVTAHPLMLTEADLRRIIAAGEKYDVEFKGEAERPLTDRELVEAVACQANGRGGVLLIGVENDGRLTGARARHGSYTDPRREIGRAHV